MTTNVIKAGYIKILGKVVKIGSKKHLKMQNEIRIWNQTPLNER